CVVLTYVGGKPAEEPYILIGRLATVYYFVHILILLPLVGFFEKPKPLPASISEDVLGKKPSAEEASNA
ncbi:MAG: cytochrome b, partial [Sneathiella sp.]